jgi:hypothetical protein
MTNDFWRLKRKKNIGLRLQPLRLRPINVPEFKDTDKDKIPDRFDCEPYNPSAQGVLHYVKGVMQKREAPRIQARAEDLMSEGDHMIKTGMELGDNEMVKAGEELMQIAYQMQEAGQVEYTEGERILQEEGEAIKKDIRKGLRIQPEYYKSARRYAEGPSRIPRITRPRRLLPEEKLSPNFQQSSIFPNTAPYRPISEAQAMPKVPLITSPFAQRMRIGQPYVFPRPYSPFRPHFVGARRGEEYYEE